MSISVTKTFTARIGATPSMSLHFLQYIIQMDEKIILSSGQVSHNGQTIVKISFWFIVQFVMKVNVFCFLEKKIGDFLMLYQDS